jgi:hypothetical protein
MVYYAETGRSRPPWSPDFTDNSEVQEIFE